MEFSYNGKTYSCQICRKQMKYIRIHVREDGSVCVSAPYHAPESVIRQFVEENAAAVIHRAEAITRQKAAQHCFADGAVQHFLGKEIRLHYTDKPCHTELEQDVLTLFARTEEEAQHAFRQWMISRCVALYRQVNREVYEHFKQAGYPVPLARIEIKEMTTRWGSCTASSGRISMNLRLMQYPVECIYAVFYHEYTHFMEQNHSKAFYRILYQMFPAYDKWDAVLKQKG